MDGKGFNMTGKSKRPYISVPDEELREIKHEAIEEGEPSGAYMLKLIRIGRAAKIFFGKYLWGMYSWRDFLDALNGEKPDIEVIKEQIEQMGRGLSLREYQKKLLDMKKALEEGKRQVEIRQDLVEEKLDELEHLIEELGGDTILEKKS